MVETFYVFSSLFPCVYTVTPLRRMRAGKRDDFLLVRVSPWFDGRPYGLDHRVFFWVLAARFEEDSLFPVGNGPCPVHILIPRYTIGEEADLDLGRVEHLVWGELYRSRWEAVAARNADREPGRTVSPKEFVCPVCGWPHLTEPVRDERGIPSYEICPSCGYQFGIDDREFGLDYDIWRDAWIRSGRPWWSESTLMPMTWDPFNQIPDHRINSRGKV